MIKNIMNSTRPLVYGMVHVQALPGTPFNKLHFGEILTQACKEAELLIDENLDGIIVENMFDIPYLKPTSITQETTAFMTRICGEISKLSIPSDFTKGVQVLAGCNEHAVAVANACDFDFVRAEGYVFGHVGDEGYFDACAGSLLRFRKRIGAEKVAIFTDVKKKHSAHAITSDISLSETAKAAEFFGTDGVIVTGRATGEAPNQNDIDEVKHVCPNIPLLVGSGITRDNMMQFKSANVFIVGSSFKKYGLWSNEICSDRVKRFMSVYFNLFC